MAQPMRETMRGQMREMREEMEERGPVFGIMEQMARMPSSTYWFAMLGSLLGSLTLFLMGQRWASLFVGLWVPTFLNVGLFYKLLHPEREQGMFQR